MHASRPPRAALPSTAFSKWSTEEEPLPRDGLHARALGCGAPGRVADDERPKFRVTSHEFQQGGQIPHLEPARLDLDRPRAPFPLEDSVDLERLLAPVGDSLPGIPC